MASGSNLNIRLQGRFLVAALVLSCSAAKGDEETEFFKKKIQPVLQEHCFKCHSAKHDRSEGGLRVDSREAMQEGGDSGAAVVP
ncbi:MAG: c-type cytochrome domain-containing protein, partial [Planctomycetota bacterium]|nr:c-type cytochrome domain-containing protein [Planctomycetota bacterium]